jgi:hypothetical protein
MYIKPDEPDIGLQLYCGGVDVLARESHTQEDVPVLEARWIYK